MKTKNNMKNIVVVGATGAGKTTLSKKLSQKFSIPSIDLDELFWLPGWIRRDQSDFIDLIEQNISSDGWVVSGNYSKTNCIIWPQADIIVWLDYPFWLCFWQILKRGIQNIIKKKEFCNGNYETLRGLFFSRKSIFLWLKS